MGLSAGVGLLAGVGLSAGVALSEEFTGVDCEVFRLGWDRIVTLTRLSAGQRLVS